MSESKKRYKNKPRKCIFCGSTRIATYVYGYPSSSILKDVEAGKIAIGGCCLGEDNPRWRCSGCGHQFYLKAPWEE
ncbi:hypothetical protein [Marinifilum fragile]|uniref:hypothetical protein n=1 Tax=Marinifilum fragile TaxID=570161 RepID=UPI0006D235D5|nr:hypothetical protein [Marinifilum fragile]